VWVRSSGGDWFSPGLVPTTGSASYTTDLDLTGVPAGLGYEVVVAYRPVAGSGAFANWATSPGNFSVDMAAPVLSVTALSGGYYSQASDFAISWTTTPGQDTGEYGVWLYDGTSWYLSQLVAAPANTATVGLGSVLEAGSYCAVVAYRPHSGIGAFVSWATSPDSFVVTPPE
jgi:hypothetical protein